MEAAGGGLRRWGDDRVEGDAGGQGEVQAWLAERRGVAEGRARREREVAPRELAGRDDRV